LKRFYDKALFINNLTLIKMKNQNLLLQAAIILIAMLMTTFVNFSNAQEGSNEDLINQAQELLHLYNYTPPTPGAIVTPEMTPKESWENYYAQQYQNAMANGIKAPGDMTVKIMPTYYVWPGETITLWGNVSWESYAGTGNYYWDFGDGNLSPVYAITDNKYLDATHSYPFMSVFYASLFVTDDLFQTEIATVQIVVTNNVRETRRQKAIEDGLRYLYLQQYADGHWTGSYSYSPAPEIAATSLALLSYEENGHRPWLSPADDIYKEVTQKGIEYLWTEIERNTISVQTAGDPDSDANGYGYHFAGSRSSYSDPIALAAIVESNSPTQVITNGPAWVQGQTYHHVVQNLVDEFAWSQTESGNYRGGWRYDITTSNYGSSDMSTTQWPVLSFVFAEDWGIFPPTWVKTELDLWTNYAQNTDGHFGYTGPGDGNTIARLGSGAICLYYLGYGVGDTEYDNMINYYTNHFTYDDGYSGKYGLYAMYKGLNIYGLLTQNLGAIPWYSEYVDFLTTTQGTSGDWPGSWGSNALNTGFSILVLTPHVITSNELLAVDIRMINNDMFPEILMNTEVYSLGLPLSGLSASEFIVTENGVVQNIELNYVADQYVITYTSSNPVPDEGNRIVRVEVNTTVYDPEQGAYVAVMDYDVASYLLSFPPVINRTIETIELSLVSHNAGTTFQIETYIEDFVAPFLESASLFYRSSGAKTEFTESQMFNISGNLWRGFIPGNVSLSPGVDYYISATDGTNTSTDPESGPTYNPYQIPVDNALPEITHTPVLFSPPETEVVIDATAFDDTDSVVFVNLHYRAYGELYWHYSQMNFVSGIQYLDTIPGGSINNEGAEYYISAQDNFGLTGYFGTADDPIRISSSANGIFSGNVSEIVSGEPLPNVTVLMKSAGVLLKSVETGEYGNYLIPNVPPGSYTLEANKTGYSTAYSGLLSIIASQETIYNFYLEISDETDLAVSSITTVPAPGEENPLILKLTVNNYGGIDISDVAIVITTEDLNLTNPPVVEFYSGSIPIMPAFGQETVEIPWTPASTNCRVTAHIDPDNIIPEPDEQNNVLSHIFEFSPPEVLSVIAQYDGNNDPEVIGQFMSGIPGFINVFTATVFDPEGSSTVDNVEFQFGDSFTLFDYDGSDGWSVEANMEGLPGEDFLLEVFAYDQTGMISEPMVKTIDMFPAPAWYNKFVLINPFSFENGYFVLDLKLMSVQGGGDIYDFSYTIDYDVLLIGSSQSEINGGIAVEFGIPLNASSNPYLDGGFSLTQMVLDENVGTNQATIEFILNPDYSLQAVNFNFDEEIALYDTEYGHWSETGVAGIQALLDIGFDVFANMVYDASITSDLENSDFNLTSEITNSINGTNNVQMLYGLTNSSAVVSPRLSITFDLDYSTTSGFSSNTIGEFEVGYNIISNFFWGLYDDDIIAGELGPWDLSSKGYTYDPKLDTTLILPQSLPYPMIRADAHGNLALIWISDKDTAQAQINPEVAFTYRPHEHDWLTPVDITSNNLFESSPDISFMNNGDLMAVWTQNSIPSTKDESDIYEILNAQDIFYAIYDTVTGWGASSAIIEDAPGDLYSDGIPSVSFSDLSQGLVLWTRSVNNIDPLAAGAMDIYYSTWGGTSWSAPAILIYFSLSNFEPVVRYNKTGNTALAVWLTDADGMPQTESDNGMAWSYWTGSAWSTPGNITSNSLTEKTPTLAPLSNGDFVCCWVESEFDMEMLHQEHRLHYSVWDHISMTWNAPGTVVSDSFLIEEPVVNTDSRDIAGVVWKGYEGFDGELYFSANDMTDVAAIWTAPQLLTDDELTDWLITAAIDAHNNVHFVDFKYDFQNTTSKGTGAGDFYDGLTFMSYGLKDNGTIDSLLNHGIYAILPDLYIQDSLITFTPDTVFSVGDTVSFSSIYRNAGTYSSGQFSVSVYQNGTLLNTFTDSLSAGESENFDFEWIAEAGSHTFTVLLDSANVVEESVEDNNSGSIIVQVAPDLTVLTIVPSDENPFVGNPVQLYADICNLSGSQADDIIVRFYDDVNQIGSDIIIDSLVTGDTIQVLINYTAVWGERDLSVIVNPDSLIPESNYDNNSLNTILDVRADLTLYTEQITFDDQDSIVAISAYIHNIGGVIAFPTNVQFWLGNPLLPESIKIGETPTPVLPPLDSTFVSINWNAPFGQSVVYLKIDSSNVISERNEANNQEYSEYLRLEKPDLLLNSIQFSQNEIQQWDTLQIEAMIINPGTVTAANVQLRCYDGDPLSGGIEIGSTASAILEGGDTVFLSVPWFVGDATIGQHQVFVLADPDNIIDESNETNNSLSDFVTVIANTTSPVIEVNPVMFDVAVESGSTLNENLGITNTGGSLLEYAFNTQVTEPPKLKKKKVFYPENKNLVEITNFLGEIKTTEEIGDFNNSGFNNLKQQAGLYPDNFHKDKLKTQENGDGLNNPGNGAGMAGLFDGSGDYVEVADAVTLDISETITVSAWVYGHNYQQNDIILHKSSAYGLRYDWSGSSLDNNEIMFFFYDGGTWRVCDSDFNPEIETWYHFAATYDKNTQECKFYVNGNLAKTTNYSQSINNGTVLRIGGWDSGSNDFNGRIDEVRIWNYARNQTEIQSTMYSQLSGDEVGLVGYWTFDNHFLDMSGNGNNGTAYGDVSFIESEAPIGTVVYEYASADVPLAVGPAAGVITESTLEIIDEYLVGDVNLTLDLEHTFVSDLTIELISPEGTSIILSSLNGGGGENYQVTTFNDEALTYITDGSAPFDGEYKPFPGSLSLFDAELVTGTWTLRITDNVNSDGGTLNDWSLRIEKFGPAWLLLSPMYGTVTQTNTENNQVSFVSGDMNPGTYYADILINNNDPSNPQYQVPTTTTINGNPEIYFSVDTLDFDTVYMGYPDTLELTLFNLGNGIAEISDIQFTNIDFSVDNSVFTIPVGESFIVNVAFDPSLTGYIEDTLTVISNDAERQIILTGFGIVKPTIIIYPEYFIATLNTGDSETQFLTIQNTGDALLEFNTEARLDSDTSVVINWAFTEPQTGIVQLGDTDTLQLIFDATGLPGGNYLGELWINNNDPASIKEIAGLDLTVIDAPDIDISADSLIFADTVFVGVQDTLEVVVRNFGFDTLFISNVASDNPVFFADPLVDTIPPADSIYLSVIFAPDATSYFSGTLTIQSNDEPENIFAEGYGLMPPVIILSDTEFTQILNVGESASQTLTITNNGNSDLEYEAIIRDTSEYIAVFDGSGDYISIPDDTNWELGYGDFTISFWMTLANLNKVHDGLFGRNDFQWLAMEYNHDSDHRLNLWIDNNGSSGWDLNNLKPTKSDWEANTWYHIAVVRDGNSIKILVNGLEEISTGYTQQAYNPAGVPVYFGRSQLSGRNHQGNMDEIRIWDYARSETQIQSDMNSALTGNEAGLLGYWNFNGANPWADKTAYGNDGQAYGDTQTIESDLNISPSWAEILTNASGTIAPSGNVDVDMQFNAFDIIGGNYEANLQIINNDPFDPEIDVPLYLTVIGTPTYELTPDSLNFGTIYFGETTDLDFSVTNTGTDSLFVTGINTGNADFTAFPDIFKVAVDSSQVVTVTYLPSAAGADLGEVILVSNAVTSDTVALTGNAIDPPVIGVDPTSITDAIYIGDKATHELKIENTGGSDLNYHIVGNNFGDGSDGELTVNLGDTYYMDAVKSKVDGTNAAGQNTIFLFDASGFSVGDEVLIISMQDPETDLLLNVTGQYETRYIFSIVGNTLTLDDTLLYTYDQTGDLKHQVIRIPQYTNVIVDGTITCDAWDGEIGGIVFFRTTGTVTVNSGGSIDVSGKGYRGHNRQGDNQNGYQGESIFGTGVQSTLSNMNAGGGGQHAYAGGGGGGYAEYGETGQIGNGGTPGNGGESTGDSTIQKLFFGGAGGTGGDNDSGLAQNPNGGMGAGIIFLAVYDLSGSGTISSNGGNGNSSASQDGGAGGGAGGTIWVKAKYNNISLIEANSGIGFTPPNPDGGKGGDGSVGRIRIDGDYGGTVNPIPYNGEYALSAWITAIPEQGTVPAGESDTVEVTLDATILSVGLHTADLEILSNDIINDEVIVPVNLTVNPGVGIVVVDTFRIDNVNVDSTEIAPLVIRNVGTQTLSITNIVLTDANSVFGISGTSFTIPAEDQDTLWVTFIPTSALWFEASLQIFSNDPTDPTLDVVLLGNGITAPVIDVSPVSFNVIVPQNDSLTETLTINNIGGSDLTFEIESFDTLNIGAGMAASFDGSGDYIQIPDNSLWDFGTGDLTVELWANWSAISTNSTYMEIGYWGNSILIRQNSSSSFYLYFWGSSYGYSLSPTLGEWFHLTVRRYSGQLEVFINGVQLGSTINSTHNIQISNVVRIGSSVHAGGQYFNGNMDEVRIWNIARTDEEIQSKMNSNLTGSETGLIGYWNFNEANPWEDLSGNGNDGTANGDVTVVESTAPVIAPDLMTFNIESGTIPRNDNRDIEVTFHSYDMDFGVYETNIQVINNDTTQDTLLIPVTVTVPASDIEVSPPAFTVNLASGDTTSRNLTISNDGFSDLIFEIEDTDGPGMAGSFDGSGDYVHIGDKPELEGMDSLTIECWVNTNIGSWIEPFGKNYRQYQLTFETNNNRFGMYKGYDGSNHQHWYGYHTFNTNQWYHLAVSWTGNTITFFVNGVQVNQYTDANSNSIPTNGYNFQIGRRADENSYYLNGEIDEVRIWDITRTEGEIQSTMFTSLAGNEPGLAGYWNFNGTNPWADLTENGNNGTPYGNATTTVSSANIVELLSFENVHDTIVYNGNYDLEFLVSSENLPVGSYNPAIKIVSNDTADNILYVPVTLNVTDAAGIFVSSDTLNFGEQFVGSQTTLSLYVKNVGSDTLEINNVQIIGDKFSYAGSSPVSILPGDSLIYEVTFEPDLVQTEAGEISFTSNDPTNVVQTVVLTGEGIVAPEIDLSPDPIEIFATTQSNIYQGLNIQNMGGNPLEYEFYPVKKSDSTLWHYAYVVNYYTGSLSLINLETQAVTNVSGFYSNPHNIDMTPDGRYLWITNANDNEISIYDIQSGSHKVISAAGIKRYGTSFSPDGSIAYVADVNNNRIEVYNTVTYELLNTFGGSLSNPMWPDITADGKYLYICDTDIDDIVVLNTETGEEVTSISGFTDPWGLEISPNGEWFAFRDGDNVKIGETETNTIIFNVPGIDNPRTPVWTPDNKYLYVGSWDAYKIHKIETETFTEVKVYNMPYRIWGLALTEDNEFLVASCGDNDRVAIIELETDDISYVTVQDYPVSIVTFRTKQPVWLEEISQLSGTLQPDSTDMIDLTLNTTEIPGGDYYAQLWFNTNDPLASDFKYDITLHHNTGNPYMVASDDSLDFGNVWTGYPDSVVLTISNTGTETLDISSLSCNPGQFYTSETQLDIDAGSEYNLTVYCNASTTGILTGSLSITSNGGNLSVYLEAYSYAPPVADVSPDQISVTLAPDVTNTQLLTLTNIGVNDLEYYTTVGMHRDKYFIGNNNKYQVLVWNAVTNTTETIDLLFSGPWRMKYSPDGRYLWVTFEDQGYVAVLDANTNAVVQYILVEGTRTSGVAFNKTGTYAYIGNWSENRVEIINTADYTWEGSITGSMSAPKELILVPDTSKLFVTNNGNDDIVIIDLNTNTVVQSIDGNSTGYDLAISPDGNFVYWIDRYYVRKVNTETNSVVIASSNFGELRGVTISDDGQTLYVCAYGNDKVIALETENLTQINEWSAWDEIHNPIDITLSFDRVRLYVTLESDNKVTAINLSDDVIETTYSLGSSDMDFRDITGAGRISWLNVDLENDILSTGENSLINFDFDTEDMGDGTYYADFGIHSNDPNEPEILIPVTLTVEQTYITLDIKAFLEGPYSGTLMIPDLNPVALPLSQPYSGSPWNYSGTENVGVIPNANVVDWILAELRETAGDASTATEATQVAQQSLFILNDGSVVGLDGVSNPQFNISLSHQLYVVLWHRNHLGIMSANALTPAGGVYTYDFTTGSGQAYGTDAQKNLGGGVYGLFGSDGNADGNINTDDKNNIWIPQAGTQGYKSGDFNLDVQVDNKDKNDIWLPNIGEGSQVPE